MDCDNEMIDEKYNCWDMYSEKGKLEHDIILKVAKYIDLSEYGLQSIRGEQNVRYIPKTGMIRIYTDHNPPHCHVCLYGRVDVKIRLDTFEVMNNVELSRNQRKGFANYLDNGGKEELRYYWNKNNPDKPFSYQ